MTSIPESARSAQTDTGGEVIVGVDTHADRHVAALLSTVGVRVATATFSRLWRRLSALLAWACGHAHTVQPGTEIHGQNARSLTDPGANRASVHASDCRIRVWCTTKISTFRRLSHTVSMIRKSHAVIRWAWAQRNWFQVWPERRGAGSMPAAVRTCHTVDGAT